MYIYWLMIFMVSSSQAQVQTLKDFSYHKIDNQFSPLLAADIYIPDTNAAKPVVVFIHGGGWQIGDKDRVSHVNKRNFFLNHGFIFISVNYRLAPAVFYPVYPQDVARSIAFVFNWIGKFNGDPNNVFLMGHSAGAHLAALVATDRRYLNEYNHQASKIKGVIVLDGAGYDIPALMDYHQQQGNTSSIQTYQTAFGEDPLLWQEASPINYSYNNTAPFQLFYVAQREISQLMSESFAQELRQAGNSAQVIPVFNSSHPLINSQFGAPEDIVSQQALEFIQNIMTKDTF